MNLMIKTCLCAALLAGASATQACNEVVLLIPDFTVVDAFVQDPAEKVDILLVIDNSCSMLAEQDKLSEEFEAFTEFFLVADTDFHIGITTTDMDVEAGRLVGDPAILTRATPDPAAVFRENVLVGAEGSGFEKGLQAAWSALSPTLTSGPNAGFYREEAALSVIFVSDEDDGSNYPVADWLDAFWDLKGQRNRHLFTASALTGVHPVTNEPASCGELNGDPFAGARDAPRYWEIVNETHGVIRSICSEDFNELISEIGLAVSGLRDRFYLTQEPRDPTALEVVMFIPGTADFNGDGTPLPPEGIDGEYVWVYETASDDYWIRFVDTDSLPEIGSRMTVTYEGR
jgi:hypothetical protein